MTTFREKQMQETYRIALSGRKCPGGHLIEKAEYIFSIAGEPPTCISLNNFHKLPEDVKAYFNPPNDPDFDNVVGKVEASWRANRRLIRKISLREIEKSVISINLSPENFENFQSNLSKGKKLIHVSPFRKHLSAEKSSRNKRIFDMAKNGMSGPKIAQKENINVATVHRVLKQEFNCTLSQLKERYHDNKQRNQSQK